MRNQPTPNYTSRQTRRQAERTSKKVYWNRGLILRVSAELRTGKTYPFSSTRQHERYARQSGPVTE